MMNRRWWFAVACGAVVLTTTPALARGGFSFSFHGGLGAHHGFPRHFGSPFFGGVPHHHRFGPPFGFHRSTFFFGVQHPRFFDRTFVRPEGHFLAPPLHRPPVIMLRPDPLRPWWWR